MLNRYEARFSESSRLELDLQDALDEAANPLRLLEEFCFEIDNRDPPYDPKEFFKLVIGTISPFLSDFDYICSLGSNTNPRINQGEQVHRDFEMGKVIAEAIGRCFPKTSQRKVKGIVRDIICAVSPINYKAIPGGAK